MEKKRHEKLITLQLSTDDVNLIFKALSERPFHEVYQLIGKINEQSNRQLSAIEKDFDLRRNT